MKRIMRYVGVTLFIFLLLGSFASAQINDNNTTSSTMSDGPHTNGIVTTCWKGGKPIPCEKFSDLIIAIQNTINFGVKFALAFSVVPIAIAGFLYLRSGDNPGDRTKANNMLKNVAIGIVVMLAAWLIVNLITNSLVTDEVKKGFFPI